MKFRPTFQINVNILCNLENSLLYFMELFSVTLRLKSCRKAETAFCGREMLVSAGKIRNFSIWFELTRCTFILGMSYM